MKYSLKGFFYGVAISLVFGFASNAAFAQTASTDPTLIFTEPTGIVSPTDSIDVNLRFTAGSGGFIFDASQTNYGLDLGWLSAKSGSDITSITGGNLTVAFGCSGTFTFASNCIYGPPYDFSWSFSWPTSLNLTSFQYIDYLFGTFNPSAGPVAPGTYVFYRSHLFASLSGTENVVVYDDQGNPVVDDQGNLTYEANQFSDRWFDLAVTCNDGDSSCAFTRTVVGEPNGNVPEPGSLALLAVALSMLGLASRRRSAV